jgi:thioredoxin 1
MVSFLKTEDFQRDVLEAGKPVLVDFTASWCPPCKVQLPIFEQLSEQLGETAAIYKVDVDADHALAAMFHVQSIPTLLVFMDGKVAQRFQGVTRAETLRAALAA